MSINRPEIPNPYNIKLFERPLALKTVLHSFANEGFSKIRDRAKTSSVPPYLGYLIESIRNEAEGDVKNRRQFGGSNFLADPDMETAYRVFGHQFPTHWAASYALAYGAAVAFNKAYFLATSKTREAMQNHADAIRRDGSTNVAEIQHLSQQALILSFTTDGIGSTAIETASYAVFMENFAKGPSNLLDRLVHAGIKWVNHYPSVDDLTKVRDIVDNRFDDPIRLNSVFWEAQRLQVLNLRFLI